MRRPQQADHSADSGRRRRLTYFGALAGGQVVSLFGSRLTSFVIGVWVYQQTGSATAFSLIAFFAVVPEILLAPIAGSLVDRWDRRRALLLGDAGAGVTSVVLVGLAWTGDLHPVYVYVLTAVASACQSVQYPALTASTTLLVPKRHLARANSLMELGFALVALTAPAVAGALLGILGLAGVLLIDVGTFVVALITLNLVRIPRPRSLGEDGTPAGEEEEEESGGFRKLLHEAWEGWQYVRRREGLLALLFLFASVNFAMGIVQISLTPLVLSFASAAVLGTIMSAAGGGFAVGSALMAAWGGPRNKVAWILALFAVQGATLFLGGLQPSAMLIAGAAFFFTFFTPIIYACTQAIWQSKVAPSIQGRVFAIRRMVAWSFMPLAYLVAGPLVDQVFGPLLEQGGLLAGSVGQVIGVGPGRGVGLMFIVLGLVALGLVVVGALFRPLRQLETDLPDAIEEDEGAASERHGAQLETAMEYSE